MLRLLKCLTLAILVAGCSAGGGAGPVISSGERYSTAATPDYRLDAGDKLRITVFNEDTLSGEFAVGTEGTLSFPLIGDVPAKGKTPQEVAAAIQAQLANGYLREPKVSAEVSVYRPFFILGEVKAPGQYPYASGMTAVNAIATAQGFSPRASRKIVYIRGANDAAEVAMKLTPDLKIKPGDTIRVGERYF